MIFTSNILPYQNIQYLKFQVDASRFTDTIRKPEFWTLFHFLSIHGGILRQKKIFLNLFLKI